MNVQFHLHIVCAVLMIQCPSLHFLCCNNPANSISLLRPHNLPTPRPNPSTHTHNPPSQPQNRPQPSLAPQNTSPTPLTSPPTNFSYPSSRYLSPLRPSLKPKIPFLSINLVLLPPQANSPRIVPKSCRRMLSICRIVVRLQWYFMD